MMTKRVFAAALATVFLGISAAAPAVAETKELTPQQQKMKDCSAKWKDEKTKTGVRGRTAHNKFMSTCLKD
jgi:Ni/Co efflux regulator RcnB